METAMISVIIYSLWPSPFPRFIVLFFLASQVLQQSEQSKGYQPSSPYSATFCTAAQLPFPRAFYPSLTIHIGIVLNPDQATSRLDYKHLKWLQTHARCTPILFPVSVQVFRTAKHKKIESTFPAIIMSSEKKTLSNVRAGLLVARGLTENRLPAACQVLTDLRMQCHLAFCGCGRGDKGEYGVEEISDWVRRVGSPFSRVVGNPSSRAGNCKASTSILAYCLYHLLIWVCVFQPFHSLHWMGRVYQWKRLCIYVYPSSLQR